MAKKLSNLIILMALLIIVIVALLWVFFHHKPTTQAVDNVTVDFQNRTGGTTLSQYWFGVGGVGTTLSDPAGMKMLSDINLTGNRMFIEVPMIYPVSTNAPNWDKLNAQLDRSKSAGMRNEIVIEYSPSDLNAQKCGMPSDVNKWASLASSIIQHIEQRYPSVAYEIWNEPDMNASFCTTAPLQNWLNLFAAVAPLIRANAASAHIGGPCLGNLQNAQTWLSSFLSDARTAPYVDFVSMHLYITGNYENGQPGGMSWDMLYNATTGKNGVAYYYKMVEGYVRAGKQPNAATTPIAVTEYNSNYAYSHNCCQNDTRYGPLWNATAITEWLNVTQTQNATAIPTRVKYFASVSTAGYFCLIDTVGTTDCAKPGANGSQWYALPQYMFYQLMASPAYLNLENTGAQVVRKPTFGIQNIYNGAALFTPTSDVVLLINPWSSAHLAVPLYINNSGLTNVAATEYTLNQGVLLSQQAKIVVNSPTQFTVLADLPGYSTVVIKLTGS